MNNPFDPLVSNCINAIWNYTKRILICSWKGHDVVMVNCFRCWKWDKTWNEDN